MTVKRQTSNKPWVTDQFRRLIQCRQYALKTGGAISCDQKPCEVDVEDVAAELLRRQNEETATVTRGPGGVASSWVRQSTTVLSR